MTHFQQCVYDYVKTIPAGAVRTYKQVAVAIGHPQAYRAVGTALNKNYNPDIPCHRVVPSNGKLGGYNRGHAAKRKKLAREGVHF